MIWEHWSTRHLQLALAEIDADLYDNLAEILPPLRGPEAFNPTELDSKKNLVKILMSFASSDYFAKKANMEKCLTMLPPKVLRDLIQKLAQDGFSIGGSTHEEKVNKILAIRWQDRKFAASFIEFFDLPEHFMPPEPVKVPSFIDIEPLDDGVELIIPRAYKTLIDFQSQVYLDSMRKISVPRSRFIIQMPTGSGKTRTSMQVIAEYLKMAEEGAIVFWLAHSQELCEQAFHCFIEVWQYLANKPLKAVRCWGKHSVPPPYDKSMFIVGGFQKVHAALKRNDEAFAQISQRIGLIVVDEAHKAVAPTYKHAISKLKGDNTNVIGLTATPGRTEIEETEEMAEFFFESKVNIKTDTGESEIEMLKARKVLAQIDYIPIQSPLNLELTTAQKRKLEQDFDFPPGFLKKVGSSNVRNIEIMKRLLLSCKEGRRILFFSCSVAHSKFIMSLLIYFGINAAHVDGSTSDARREQVIEDFKHGNVQVLCNYGVLTTGFDAPNTDEVFISRPTNSVVLYSQMIGRGLRGPTIGGTERCRISDVKDNIHGFGDQIQVYHWFEEFWDN